MWHDPSAVPLTQTHSITFPHSSQFKKNACKNSLIRLEDQIFLLLINSKHDHLLLNRLPARFYRILCIFSLYARRPIGSHPPTKKCLQPPMVQWHCHVVSRYGRPYTSRECVAMRSCHCAAGVKQSGGLSSVCVLQS